jgi:hypothetical protein
MKYIKKIIVESYEPHEKLKTLKNNCYFKKQSQKNDIGRVLIKKKNSKNI